MNQVFGDARAGVKVHREAISRTRDVLIMNLKADTNLLLNKMLRNANPSLCRDLVTLESASNYCIETVQTGCGSGEQRQINEHATRMGTLETADKEADG